jgi:serine/threonine protein kinase
VELTPDWEYLLVTEFFQGVTELGEAEVDDGVVDDGLSIIRKLWDAGMAHRDIKPANLLVRDGRMLLIDVAFAEARPSPCRQAVDLQNMMMCLALYSSPERVYRRALRQLTVEEITEALARFTLPGGVRPPWFALGWRCRPSCAGSCAPRAVTRTPSSCGCYPARRRRCRSSGGVPAGSGWRCWRSSV